MTGVLLATGAFIGAFAVLGFMAIRHACKTGARQMDDYPVYRRPQEPEE